MKLLVLLLLIPILLESSSAVPVTAVDEYGRVFRTDVNPELQQLNDDSDDDVEDDDDNDDDADDDENGGIYPPDFAKLFPNPDGRPVGPDSYDSYQKHHPANHQPNKPTHGPASSVGPAASRGPVPQRAPPRNQASGNHGGYARPQYDAPPPRRQSQGPPPQYDAPPPRRYSQGGPGPGPERRQYSGPPPPQYRTENFIDETEPEEPVKGRQLYYTGGRRQVVPMAPTRNMYWSNTRRNYQTYAPMRTMPVVPGTRRYTAPRGYPVVPSPVPATRRYTTVPRGYAVVPARANPWPMRSVVQGPVSWTRNGYGRDYPRTTPFSRYSIHSDYNPEYIINPTAMLSRRKFRYHSSQRVPSQRVPIYNGYWPNPWIGHHYQKW